VLATLWEGTAEAIQLSNPKNLAEKIVIDVTNPLDFSKGMPPSLALGHTDSGGRNRSKNTNSKVVKVKIHYKHSNIYLPKTNIMSIY